MSILESETTTHPVLDILDVMVVTCEMRNPIITKHLDGIPHHVLCGTGREPLPEGRNWPFDWMNNHSAPSYRCFTGHQKALAQYMTKPYALLFEDDAIPTRKDWLDVAAKAIRLFPEYEIVSLHGRNMPSKSKRFEAHGETWVVPDVAPIRRHHRVEVPSLRQSRRTRFTYVGNEVEARLACGSLAYIVNRESANRLIAWEYDGFPLDILIVDKFKACVCDPSPFLHPTVGSLVNTVKD